MGNWKDPNLKNHVNIEDSKFKYGDFNERIVFKNRPTDKNYPYLLKDLHNEQNFIFKSINNEKREKYINILSNNSPRYNFISSSNNKTMQDSFYSMGNVYLYQLILNINKIWTILDYNDNNLPVVTIPSNSNITDILSELLSDQQFHNVQELTNEEDIRNAIERIVIDIQDDKYGISEILSEKLYLSKNQIIKRLKSPLIKKYLSTQLNKLLKNKNNSDEEFMVTEINNMVKNVNIYKKDNNI